MIQTRQYANKQEHASLNKKINTNVIDVSGLKITFNSQAQFLLARVCIVLLWLLWCLCVYPKQDCERAHTQALPYWKDCTCHWVRAQPGASLSWNRAWRGSLLFLLSLLKGVGAHAPNKLQLAVYSEHKISFTHGRQAQCIAAEACPHEWKKEWPFPFVVKKQNKNQDA